MDILSSPTQIQFPRQKSWRQRNRIQRTLEFVKSEFARVVSSSSVLQEECSSEPALFHRSEIVTGAELGTGGFAIVHEIKEFCFRDDISEKLSHEQQAARKRMADTAVVNGKCRYAIKHLRLRHLDTTTFSRAAADLAIEAAFLSALDHPNILSLQGLPVEGIQAFSDGTHDGFFLIMERLTDTLEGRINEWSEDPATEASLDQKLNIAQQLADTLRYLHERRIVFRDLKPANIGFSQYGDKLKLFDFGLSTELPKLGNSDDTYVMSGSGTRRYMAVEVVKKHPYNCKADVYGWSMVLWEILTLTKPYEEYSAEEHYLKVCKLGERPTLSASLPYSIQSLLEDCWTGVVSRRLAMSEICKRLDQIEEGQQKVQQPRVIRAELWKKICMMKRRSSSSDSNTSNTSEESISETLNSNATTPMPLTACSV